MKVLFALLLLLLISCSKKDDGSHLPSPLELPGAIIGSTVDNALYEHRRTEVKNYVIGNYLLLQSEIKVGDGAHFDVLLDKVNIKTSQRAQVKQALQKEHATMFKNIILNTEAIMNIFSALYPPQEGTKTMNGFTYTQAYNIVQAYLNEHFESYKLSLKNKTTQGLVPLSNDLNIQESEKQNLFYENLWKRYDALIIEPVVVTVMAYTN